MLNAFSYFYIIYNIVSEFQLQLHHYVHFQTNTFGKGISPLILPAMS